MITCCCGTACTLCFNLSGMCSSGDTATLTLTDPDGGVTSYTISNAAAVCVSVPSSQAGRVWTWGLAATGYFFGPNSAGTGTLYGSSNSVTPCASAGVTLTTVNVFAFHCLASRWPSTATITSGGLSGPLTLSGGLFLGGVTNPTIASADSNCNIGTGAAASVSINCSAHCGVGITYSVFYYSCDGSRYPASVGYGTNPFTLFNTGTITSFTQSPFSLSGTWAGDYNVTGTGLPLVLSGPFSVS